MELLFIGADHEVTGSCHCVHANGKYILVDCGMEQGRDVFENRELPVKASQIDCVVLTHAHIDHSGLLPKLYHDGFTGQIYATEATVQLADIMLRDSAHIQDMEASYRNKKAGRKGEEENFEPLYTMEDALGTIRLFVPCRYGTIMELFPGIRVRFTDVGHLLGSASVELWLEEKGISKKIVFSGDIGNSRQPLLRDPRYTEEADYVVMESTYGDRLHEKQTMNYVEELVKILRDTFRRGGNVVIPAFAVGRTQVLLYYLREIRQKNLLPEYPDFPVYVDSPLASSATEIFTEADPMFLDEEARAVIAQGVNPISFRNLQLSISTDESRAINENTEPKVIISASGMCDAGRIRHHLKHNLWREDSTVVFVGYQAERTLGRKLLDGETSVRIFGETIQVKARIVMLQGMSGHADKDGLTAWIRAFRREPEKVFVVHGDQEVADLYTAYLHDTFGLDTFAPYSGTEFDLAAGKFITVTEGIPVKHPEKEGTEDTAATDLSFIRLRSMGEKISGLIRESHGLPHKDMDRLAEELQKLYDRYSV